MSKLLALHIILFSVSITGCSWVNTTGVNTVVYQPAYDDTRYINSVGYYSYKPYLNSYTYSYTTNEPGYWGGGYYQGY